MSNQSELFEAYEQWRTYSSLEQRAIEESDWTRVEACQNHKSQLQLTISGLTERIETELKGGPQWVGFQRKLRPILEELIAVETRVSQLLAEKRALAVQQSEVLDRSSSTLRRVRRSYGTAPQAGWISYS